MTFDEKKILEFLDDNGLDIFSKNIINDIDEIPLERSELALRSLINKGFIKTIERGKYCKHNFEDEHVIGTFIVKRGAIAYWSALNYHGLTEQIPNVIFVQTAQWKKDKNIFGVKYKFIQVKENKLVGYIKEGYGNHQFYITDREKTLVDSFDLPEYSGGYQEIIKAFSIAKINENKLIKYCKATGNIALTKRIGYLSELLKKPKMNLFLKYALSVRNEKYTHFIPYGNKKGNTNRRWRLVLNIPEDEIIQIAEKY